MKIEFPISGEGSMPLLKPRDRVTTIDRECLRGSKERELGTSRATVDSWSTWRPDRDSSSDCKAEPSATPG